MLAGPAGGVKEKLLPLSFIEEPEEEEARLAHLKSNDPITLQDTINTSGAFVEAVKDGDLEELRRVVADAAPGELLQVFTLQALLIAVKSGSLEIVRALVDWGLPLNHESLAPAVHLACEVTTRENFGDTWRILQLLVEGNSEGKIDIDTPRATDGWSPLCIACAAACLPLAFKLLEMGADPNVITRTDETPLSIARRTQPDDSEEQVEARGLMSNMLRSFGGQATPTDALRHAHRPKQKKPLPPPAEDSYRQPSQAVPGVNGPVVVRTELSETHARFCG